MSDLAGAIKAVRDAVAACAAGDAADVSAALDRPEFVSAEQAKVPGRDALDHVRLELAGPIDLADLEQLYGPARALPRRPEGTGGRTMLFEQTMPGDGESGATLLAEVDQEGRVRRLIVRADAFG